MNVRRQVEGRKGVTAKVQPSVSPPLELLEPRLLLSADLIGTEIPSPLHVSPGDCVIDIGLDRENEQLPESDPSLILSYLVPAEEQAVSTDAFVGANSVEPGASETDILQCAENRLGCAVAAPIESEGVTLQFQEEPSCLVAIDQQDATSDAERLPIEARGPPAPGAVDLSGMGLISPTLGETGVGASASSSQALEVFGVSPALFVENQGQWADSAVQYVHDGAVMDVAVTDSGVWFQATISDLVQVAGDSVASHHGPLQVRDTNTQVLSFSASFVGAQTLQPVGLKQSGSLFNYCVGDQAKWRQNVPSYEIVASEGLYDGIDLHIQGLRSHLKYEFHVAPGADFSQIAVRYEGIEGLSIAEDGSLEVDLGGQWGVIRDDAPYIYQEIDGREVEVAGRFIVLDEWTYSFHITGEIDPDHILVIDPDLAWSTYLGGSDYDYGGGIAVDTSGNVYVSGNTDSAGWTSGGFDTTYNGGGDAFVAKLSSTGAHLWSTYLGGSSSDSGQGIAVDSSGNIYVTGSTGSASWTAGGFDTTLDGWDDAFVAKLSSSGDHLWSTYVGGDSNDSGYGIAVDASGNVYVTGYTNSAGWVSGGFDTTYNGGGDAFVAKLSSTGEHLWSTYLGGSDHESGYGIAVDASGHVYVTGETSSSGWVSGGFDTTYSGGGDAFVAKLSSTVAQLWSTYLGGGSTDRGRRIAVDALGNVYVSGNTDSAGWTSGGFDTSHNGWDDAFLAKLSPAGAHLWSTYLGGSNYDYGEGIGVDASGNIYVTGSTGSEDWTDGGFDTTHNGDYDGFVAKLSAGGAHLWSTYMGGTSSDHGSGIAVDASGNIYVTGSTRSASWTSGGFDTTLDGGGDAFVVKITDEATIASLCGTYLGGSEYDSGTGTVDIWGNVYVAGETWSVGWVSGGFDTTYNGGGDGFVTKLSPSGDHLWSTYLGGSGYDYCARIVIDAAGGVYVTGWTESAGWTNGGFDTTYNGGQSDAFVAKLNANGAHLWSTYLGGSDIEEGEGITVDGSGNVYVTGQTSSAGWTSGGFDTTYNGGDDDFVAKLSATGEHLWSTYLGGSDCDDGSIVAVDGSGGVYVTGWTESAGWTSGGFDTTHNGDYDAFVAKLDGNGAHLWSTYLGGNDYDEGSDVAVDASGNVYMVGETASSGWTSGGFDATFNGGERDGFVAGLSSDGAHLWSTYLGGGGDGGCYVVAVDASGGVYVAGDTNSAGWVSGGFDETYNGGESDGFVAKLSSGGAHLWSTYLGGGSFDESNGITVDGRGAIYVAGYTESSGWMGCGFDTSYNGGGDAFVAKISAEEGPRIGQLFDIAATDERELSLSAAFDGTNFLVGIQGDAVAHYNVGAQRVGPDGSLIGDLISTGRTGGAPFVAFGGGNYLMVWTDDPLPANDEIYGQLISPSGTLVGSPFAICADAGDQDIEGIAFDGTNFLVVWMDGTDDGLYGRLVSPSGSLIGSRIALGERAGPTAAAVASDGQDFLVVWQRYTFEEGDPHDVVGRIVHGDGSLEPIFAISESRSPSYNPLSVAYNGSHYLVAWNHDAGDGYPSPTLWDVLGRCIGTDGAVLGGEVTLVSGEGDQIVLSQGLASDGDGFLLTWFSILLEDATTSEVYGRYLDSNGVAQGDTMVIAGRPGPQVGCGLTYGSDRYLCVINDDYEPFDGVTGDVIGGFVASRNGNLAIGKAVAQSSTGWGGSADKAVDGNTDGIYADGSVTHTQYNANAWWQVDLGGLCQIDAIEVWNRTDAGQDRLDDFYVFISDVPFTSTDLTTTMNQDGIWQRHVEIPGGPQPSVSLSTGHVGRYVRIQLADTNYLSLAEVEVFGQAASLVSNVAQGKTAAQSSTGWGGGADKAVDGSTYGAYASGWVTHTLYNANAWWEVDLGGLYTIDAIAIWNRTDAALDRLDDFYVFVSDEPFASTDPVATANQVGVWSRHVLVPGGPQPSVWLAVDTAGRYVRIQLADTNYLSLAEVRVFGEGVTSGANIAQGKTATQSSTGWGGSADKAVDGNTDGVYANGSVTHTQYNAFAWWQIDLGALYQIDAIAIWNRTDAGQDRLDDFYVFVSDTPFTSADPVVTASQTGVWSRHVTAIPSPDVQIGANVVGRYVRIQLADTNYLNLAEVKVFGQVVSLGSNVAQGKTATQSSTGWGGSADKAVDGNTDGVYANGSVTHTLYNANAWWQVDLGGLYEIDAMEIWNRTDAAQDRLHDFYVFVSDTPFTSMDPVVTASQTYVWSRHIVGVPSPNVQIGVDTVARYVRIQLADTNYLNLAEVKVFGQAVSVDTNVAQNKTATQSSTGWGGSANKAVDGNTDGVYANSSVTHTQYDANAWWEVDLGGLYRIDAIEIWNRTDAGQDRLDDFYIFVSDTPFTSTDLSETIGQEGIWSRHVVGTPVPDVLMWTNTVGRYVRIQLADTDYLALAEVKVFGVPVLAP